MNRSFLRILCKIALVYVMEIHIISKCVFLAFGCDMVESNESYKTFRKRADKMMFRSLFA